MIRFVRSPEPPALARARERCIAKAAAAYDAHGAPSTDLSNCLDGYSHRTVKATLYRDQRKKCAWCERVRDFSSSPLEHYRPKDGAWRHVPGQRPHRADLGHYWWLTWTWENLLFSCSRCNDRGHKANYFPLDPKSSALPLPSRPLGGSVPSACFDLGSERPMLLDPTTDSFLEHVRWVPFNTRFPRRLWSWSPKPVTARGRVTVEVLRLAELADDVSMHLASSVLPSIEEVEQHLEGRRPKQAARRWDALIKILDPENPLTAATWCALERWVTPEQRRIHGLAEPARPA